MKKILSIEERIAALEAIFLNQKEILTFREACVYAGVSPSKLYKLTSSKSIPYYKASGIHFERKDLDAWIRNHRINKKTSASF